MSARDNQRHLVYAWEGGAFPIGFNKRFKTFEEVTEFVHLIWESWRPSTQPPEVRNGGRGMIKARGWRQWVKFPYWAWQCQVIFHEVAHALNNECQYFGYRKRDKCAAHGPEFVRIYCDLVEWWTGKNIVSSASAAKVKVAPKLSWAKPQRKRSVKVLALLQEEANERHVAAEERNKEMEKFSGPSRWVADSTSLTGTRRIILTKKGLPDKRYRGS
jgi:hypothetical protein